MNTATRTSTAGVLCAIILILLVLWMMFTVGFWLLEQQFDNPTLLDVLARQLKFLKELRIW